MRIFVGFHYGPKEAWVKDYIYRLIESFGDEVVSGEKTYAGPNIVASIQAKIQSCDALIGVASRDKLVDGYYSTHPWVRDELVTAQAKGKLWLQLREQGLDPREGILEGTQYIQYDSANLTEAMVKVAEALGEWHSLTDLQPYLLPEDFVNQITPHLGNGGLICRYRILNRGYELVRNGETRIVREVGGLRIALQRVPTQRLVEIEVSFGDKTWSSVATPIDSPFVLMK